jgi:hypothetical protein
MILDEILWDISTEVLETKHVINLGQFLKIMPDIKQYISNWLSLFNWSILNMFNLNLPL